MATAKRTFELRKVTVEKKIPTGVNLALSTEEALAVYFAIGQVRRCGVLYTVWKAIDEALNLKSHSGDSLFEENNILFSHDAASKIRQQAAEMGA